MATYALPPQKGMADVLNEAADANERGMEGARRSALTMSQLQGEQQRQRFAEVEAGRAEKRFGFEVEGQEYQRRQRQREETMIGDIDAATQKYLFRDVEEPNPNATAGSIPGRQVASVDAQSGQVTPPPPATIKRRVPVDLATPEGLRGIADFQVAVFQARAKAGKVDQGEMNQLITFGNMLEQRGNRDLFRQALSGDDKATASLAAKLGLDPSNLKIEGGVDNDKNSKGYGFPNIFAVRREYDPATQKTTVIRTPIGHLAALYSPEVYDAAIAKPLEAQTKQSTITYQGKAGDAATANAAAATSDAATRATVGRSTVALNTARAAALSDGTDPVNTAAHKTSLYSSFTDADGKNIVLPSAATNKARIAGQAEALGLTRRQAQRFADEEWARITSNRADIISRMRAQKEAGGTKLPNTVRVNVGLEDEGLTSFTSMYLSSQGDEGLAARVKAYAARRASAMRDPKDED